jgi:hypothetical protein
MHAVQTMPPVVVSALPRGADACVEAAVQHLRTTHDSDKLAEEARRYARMLFDTLSGQPAAQVLRCSHACIPHGTHACMPHDMLTGQSVA